MRRRPRPRFLAASTRTMARRLNGAVLMLNLAALLWFGGRLIGFWLGWWGQPNLSPLPWMPNVVLLAAGGVLVGAPLHLALRR